MVRNSLRRLVSMGAAAAIISVPLPVGAANAAAQQSMRDTAPSSCNQTPIGLLCISRYSVEKFVVVTYINNRGGYDAINLKVVKNFSEIVKSDNFGVPAGGAVSLRYNYTNQANTFKGAFSSAPDYIYDTSSL